MTVYVDTNRVICLIERDPAWIAKVMDRFDRLRNANDQLVVSLLTRSKCLVGPFAMSNKVTGAAYRAFFSQPDVLVLSVSALAFEEATRLKARYKFERIDALHIAIALEHGCDRFLTNDSRLFRCTDIAVDLLT